MANIKLVLDLEGKLSTILRRLLYATMLLGNAFEAIFFEFAPKTRSVHHSIAIGAQYA